MNNLISKATCIFESSCNLVTLPLLQLVETVVETAAVLKGGAPLDKLLVRTDCEKVNRLYMLCSKKDEIISFVPRTLLLDIFETRFNLRGLSGKYERKETVLFLCKVHI